MKSDLFLCFGFALGSLGLTSCGSLEFVADNDPLQPGIRYEVRRALPPQAPGLPKNVPTRYFTLEAASPSSDSLVPIADFDQPNVRTVRTTAYCQSEADHLRWGSFAAAGAPLRFGMVCSAAADWSRYPLGTRFRIKSQPDVVYEVDDYGSALVGSGTIDLYRPTMGSMNAWGVRNVDIEVIHWGSFQESMRMMRDRVQYPHVRHMMLDIQRKLDPMRGLVPVADAPATVMSGPPLAKADTATASL